MISPKPEARANAVSEPRVRSEPAQRRARTRVGESEGQRPSDEEDDAVRRSGRDQAAGDHPLTALRRAAHDAVVAGPGHVDGSLRRLIAAGQPTAELADLVRKIREHAYRVTDADIDALRARYDDDQIFEIIVSAAVGAATHRLERAMAAIEDV